MSEFEYNESAGLDEIDKDPDAVLEYRLHWYEWLRGSDRYWTPRAYFNIGETATPPREAQNGKRYRCTRGGRTGSVAPSWATSSTPFSDGGVQWTLIGDEDRIDTIDFVAETGITIDSEAKDATETVGLVKLSGGTAGRSYMITCEIVTDSAQTASQRFRVNVREG
jgi:hypothetical protein